jgi:NAD+ kinase
MSFPCPRSILCLANDRSQEATAAAHALAAELLQAGFQVARDVSARSSSPPDLLVLLGGDGFLMESLRLLDHPEVPVFGVNFGSVGFLMNPRECLPILPALVREGKLREEVHPILEARSVLEEGTRELVRACNDLVVERMTRQSLRLEVAIDGHAFNRYAGDGFILSTPAGSTAYNLAAGGPVVHPLVGGLVMTPLYPHRASPFHSVQFSLVLPAASRIRIVASDLPKRSMRVVADGRELERVASVEVSGSDRKLRLLRPLDHLFVHTLTRKFIGE